MICPDHYWYYNYHISTIIRYHPLSYMIIYHPLYLIIYCSSHLVLSIIIHHQMGFPGMPTTLVPRSCLCLLILPATLKRTRCHGTHGFPFAACLGGGRCWNSDGGWGMWPSSLVEPLRRPFWAEGWFGIFIADCFSVLLLQCCPVRKK